MKKIISFTLIGLLLLIFSFGVFATSCNTVELTSILSNDMDFDKCKVMIGDYSDIFKEKGDWLITTVPCNIVNENEVTIIIKIKNDGVWESLINDFIILDPGDNVIEYNYIDDSDKKLNVKINIYNHNPCKPTPTDTIIPTSTITNNITSTPTSTTTNSITPTATSTSNITSTPDNTTTIPATETPVVTISPVHSDNGSSNQLPKTGQEQSIFPSILSALLIGSGIILYRKKEKHN